MPQGPVIVCSVLTDDLHNCVVHDSLLDSGDDNICGEGPRSPLRHVLLFIASLSLYVPRCQQPLTDIQRKMTFSSTPSTYSTVGTGGLVPEDPIVAVMSIEVLAAVLVITSASTHGDDKRELQGAV